MELADVPADVLRVGRVRNAPVVNVKRLAELRGPRLLTTATTLNLTGVKVLQNTVETEGAELNGRGGVREEGVESYQYKCILKRN